MGKHYKLLAIALLFLPTFVSKISAQCVPLGVTVTTDNLVVNTYYPGTANVATNAKSIVLGASQGAATGITKGDLLLIIQMQGSTINSTNGNSYGDGVATGNAAGYLTSVAGTYEYAIAANNVAVSGGTLYLTKGTTNGYTNAAFATDGQYRYQVIRVPRYSSLTFNASREITAAAWNGTSGGVVAFEVTGLMTVTGTFVTVDAKGFRGGGGRQLAGGAGANTDVRSSASVNANGAKGEGIAGTPQYVRTAGTLTLVNTGVEGYPNGSNGNGAPGNAGGGGTDGNPLANNQNTGGGGGGNGGAGGRGGKPWANAALNIGGYGGVAPGFLSASRIILGGGGGAGSTNDGTNSVGADVDGIASSGGAGGGIVFIKAGSISGTGIISANGENGESVAQDGGGGGGAGGSVYLTSTNTAGLANITINARGGNGGNAWSTQANTNGIPDDGNPEHGPGGGGGGGAIYTNGAIVAASSVVSGVNGTTLSTPQAYGATPGVDGIKNISSAALPIVLNAACDIDDDNDGVMDTKEISAGVDGLDDADSDGIPNMYDSSPGGSVPAFTDNNSDGINDKFDTDNDGILNSMDLDSDNDGIPDIIEAGGADTDNNGLVDGALTDTDNDGLLDTYDASTGGTEIGNLDSDRDGIRNFLDLDSDGDGLLDVLEAALPDADNNGQADGGYGTDGWSDVVDALAAPLTFPNTDGRGNPNYLDIDSDDDGLSDNIEGQSTTGYQLPAGTDADGDGIDNAYDNDDAAFAGNSNNGITPYNQDGTDDPDYMDANSDNDAKPDLTEINGDPAFTLTNTADADGDGLVDQFDVFNLTTETVSLQNNVVSSGMGNGGSATGPTPSGTTALATRTGASTERDWRNNLVALPVHFLSIAAARQAGGVQIKWRVANEESVAMYEVERSNDGNNFVKVGAIAPAASSDFEKEYLFTDIASSGENAYYRIREVSLSGSSSFSPIVAIKTGRFANEIMVYPNPINSNSVLQVNAEKKQKATIQIINTSGEITLRKLVELQAGQNSFRLDALPASGSYIVSVFIDGKSYKVKIVKH